MGRVDDYLDLVEDPSREGLVLGDPADEALLALLVQVAFSDGVLDDRELAFMQKVLPGRDPDEMREWIQLQGSAELNLDAVAEALPTQEERWTGLRFAARMAFKDESENRVRVEVKSAKPLPDDLLETLKSRILVRQLMSSSAIPSQRYSCSLFELMSRNGRTAMEGPNLDRIPV